MPENDALTHNTDTVVVHKQIGITAVSSPLPPPELLERYKGVSPKLLTSFLKPFALSNRPRLSSQRRFLMSVFAWRRPTKRRIFVVSFPP